MVVIKTPKQIKTPSNLKIAVRYILNEAKTLVSETAESDLDFPLVYHNGELQMKLVSGNGDDFGSPHETWISNHFGVPTFVMNYPAVRKV